MADLIPPVPDDGNVSFILKNWLFKVRRNLNQFASDIASILVDLTKVISTTNPLTVANISSYVTGSPISSGYISSVNADTINAGAVRGINVNASSHTTKGSFFTVAPAAAATTVTLHNTTDFHSSGGTVVVFDTTNDNDIFTYTGKTATTLTGCSGVLAHNNGATVVPTINNGTGQKSLTIDDNVNEMRFWGDRGDGTYEQLASIGVAQFGSDYVIGRFGSSSTGNNRTAVYADSKTASAIISVSDSGVGTYGQSTSTYGLQGVSSSGIGVWGNSSTSWGGRFTTGSNAKGQLFLDPLPGRPTDRTNGSVALIYTTGAGGVDNRSATPKLMVADGTDWRLVEDYTIWTG